MNATSQAPEASAVERESRHADPFAAPDAQRRRAIVERLAPLLPAHCLLHRTEDTRP